MCKQRRLGGSGPGTAPCLALWRSPGYSGFWRADIPCSRLVVCQLEMARCFSSPRVLFCVVLRGPGLQLQIPLSACDAPDVRVLLGTGNRSGEQWNMAFSDNSEGKQDKRNMMLTGLSSMTSVLALAAPLHWPESQLLAEETQTCQLLQLGHLPGAGPPRPQHRVGSPSWALLLLFLAFFPQKLY